jgi:hypothetical protein
MLAAMRDRAIVSGHLVFDSGLDRELVRGALADAVPSDLVTAGDASITFGVVGPPGGPGFGAWLETFEVALARLSDAVVRAVVTYDDPVHPHPRTAGGVHVFAWRRGDDGTLEIDDDSVLAPDFVSRFVPSMAARLDAFVAAVTDRGVIYGLRADGWARAEDERGTQRIPAWRDADRAARAARGAWSEYAPREIDLDEWVGGWLTAMVEDEIVVALEPRGPDDANVVSPLRLLERLVP